ncbi:MAG: hypothetical protein WBD87_11245 [Candidatus Acidiferrales bacterium]
MNATSVKAEISIGDKKITFEGPREFVEAMVAKYTETSSQEQVKQHPDTYSNELPISYKDCNEQDLIAMKHPKGHPEIVAVLAFALAQAGAATFTEDDIRRAYIRANVRPPKIVGQALRDAKNRFEYVEVAGKRGHYRLTGHGDRVVRFDLPRSKE